MSTRQPRKETVRPSVWVQQLGRRLTRQARTVVFLKEALYPVLCVNVHLLERSRERVGEIDGTLLGLLGLGIATAPALAYWSGLPQHRLLPMLSELVNRGLVLPPSAVGRYAIADLGRLTREHGHLTTRSCRAMLLCGITGRLLPAGAYSLPRIGFDELREKNRYLPPVFVAESATLPLSHLALSKIVDRRAVNLPDEVFEIEGVESGTSEPCFLQGVAALSMSEQDNIVSEFHLPCADGILSWLKPDQLIGLIEPLGFSAEKSFDKSTREHVYKTPEMALAEISRLVAGDEAPPVASLDPYGNPRLTFESASDALLNTRFPDDRLVMHLATSSYPGAPIHKLTISIKDRKRELLQGRPLIVAVAPGSALERRTDAVRTAVELDTLLRKQGGRRSSGTWLSKLETLESTHRLRREDIQAVAANFRLRELAAALEELQNGDVPDDEPE